MILVTREGWKTKIYRKQIRRSDKTLIMIENREIMTAVKEDRGAEWQKPPQSFSHLQSLLNRVKTLKYAFPQFP